MEEERRVNISTDIAGCTNPRWAGGTKTNHFYIPPRWGRGNRLDAWRPVCGAKGEDISPWQAVVINADLPYCSACTILFGG